MPTYWDLFLPLSWDVSKEFKLPSLTSYCFSVTSHLSLRFLALLYSTYFCPLLTSSASCWHFIWIFSNLAFTAVLTPFKEEPMHTFQFQQFKETSMEFLRTSWRLDITSLRMLYNMINAVECRLYIIVASLGREQQLMKSKIHLNKVISCKYRNIKL